MWQEPIWDKVATLGSSCSPWQRGLNFDRVHCSNASVSAFPGGPDSSDKYEGKKLVTLTLKQT